MLSVSEAEGRAAALVEAARKAGADAADVLYIGDASTEVQVRLGALEDVDRSEGEEIGLRFSSASARRASPPPTCPPRRSPRWSSARRRWRARRPRIPMPGSRPRSGCYRGGAPDLEADDGADPSPVELKERALAIEEAARAVAGITNSEGAGVSAGRTVIALATSQGFVPRLYDQRL